MASKDTLSGPSGKELPYSMAPLNLSKNEMRLVELRRNDESAIPTCILRSYEREWEIRYILDRRHFD
ncbi:hypothetical protein HBI62_211730 [Parastagonospora nodorum]|nr:hypothetical protein HBI09_178720 [Parastagonospora nodorum]KAH4863313.1 hypothetical protein HBH75_000420 [Parastagonospora nodorum]KAH5209892.1 hypothetical protein HBI62_211730 [Parastagonospora nodorum]KAH6109250.1 hypothetical protein HBI69_160630 [Parastagonospora nodorum]